MLHHMTTLVLHTLSSTDVISDTTVCQKVVDISQRYRELFDTTSQ